jgi:hypothetical protein
MYIFIVPDYQQQKTPLYLLASNDNNGATFFLPNTG